VLADMPGELAVEGHIDDVPIRTARFYSNWDLSAARSAAVENVSSENRAKNRRVEIIINMSGPLEEQRLRLRELIEKDADEREAIIDICPINPDSDSDSDSGSITW